mmetsp:Transcript_3920/g.13567  ORF Transcript_3920/g.13567 Transcript_3920/m.13567 type:complete len:358 (-) Transcript_3920:67-1140(-)
MEDADALSLIASGDVDSLRRLLKHGDPRPTVDRPAVDRPPASLVRSGLLADTATLRMQVEHLSMQLCSFRTMGKLLWPGGHAVALAIASRRAEPPPWPMGLLEVGAGAGMASLVAAALGGDIFARGVVATDCFEENVQVLQRNDSLNGSRLASVERLDVHEGGALSALVERRFGAGGEGDAGPAPLLVVACEMSYDAEAVTSLFRSAGELLPAGCSTEGGAADSEPQRAERWGEMGRGGEMEPQRAEPLVLFARSENFAHLDDHQRASAEAAGFELLRSEERTAAGALDAISETHLTPCAASGCTLFCWARRGAARTGREAFDWLLAERAGGGSDCGGEAAVEAARPDDLWAPRPAS